MSILQHEIYVEGTIALAKSMILKHAPTAELMNSEIIKNQAITGIGVDVSDPKSWKYYMNMAGEYHPLDEDMYVISLDTTQTILFNRENILQHRATFKEYGMGSQYYTELVKKYPGQEDLIKGILSPIDIDVSILAPDYTILSFDSYGVESSETNLIPKLQDWCYQTADRWVVKDFGLTDELYHADILAKVLAFIPATIMDIRLANCRTYKAHSFHVWNHLESHGALGQYKDYLTRTQVMWLYRNIEWVLNNAGKESTFMTLVEHLLTPRGIPLGKYSVRHNTESLISDLTPTVEAVRYPINLLEVMDPEPEVNTLHYVMEKSIPLARDNKDYFEADTAESAYVLARSQLSELPIKVYESEMLDTTDSQSFKLGDVLVMHWAYLSCNGKYLSSINVQNPYTTELMTMTVKEAFICWLYCMNKLGGHLLDDIPYMVSTNVLRGPVTNLEQLKKLTDSKHISDAALNHMIDLQPTVGNIVSTESFNSLCVEIHSTMLELEYQWVTKQKAQKRANYEEAARAFYADVGFLLVDTPQTYTQFFAERAWGIDTLPDTDLAILTDSLHELALGLDVSDSKTLAEIQSAMLRLMKQLGTYDTQYIQTINTSPAIPLDTSPVLLDDFDQKAKQIIEAPEFLSPEEAILDVKAKANFQFSVEEVISGLEFDSNTILELSAELGAVLVSTKSRDLDYALAKITVDIPGLGNLDELIIDGTVLDPIISRKDLVDLDDEITNNDLDGLNLPEGGV